MKFLAYNPAKLKYIKIILVAAAVVILAVSCFAAWQFFFNRTYGAGHHWEPVVLTDADRALFQAVRNDNMEDILRSLLEGGRIDAVNELGGTPFRTAIALNRLNAVREFVRPDRSNAADRWNSYLVYAIAQNRPQIVRELLRLPLDVNAIDRSGYTPLLYAINRSHVAVARELLNAGADVNAQGRDGVSPLVAAVRRGNSDMVAELLKAGADFTVPSPSGETALSIAQGNIRREVIAALLAEAGEAAAMPHENLPEYTSQKHG